MMKRYVKRTLVFTLSTALASLTLYGQEITLVTSDHHQVRVPVGLAQSFGTIKHMLDDSDPGQLLYLAPESSPSDQEDKGQIRGASVTYRTLSALIQAAQQIEQLNATTPNVSIQDYIACITPLMADKNLDELCHVLRVANYLDHPTLLQACSYFLAAKLDSVPHTLSAVKSVLQKNDLPVELVPSVFNYYDCYDLDSASAKTRNMTLEAASLIPTLQPYQHTYRTIVVPLAQLLKGKQLHELCHIFRIAERLKHTHLMDPLMHLIATELPSTQVEIEQVLKDNAMPETYFSAIFDHCMRAKLDSNFGLSGIVYTPVLQDIDPTLSSKCSGTNSKAEYVGQQPDGKVVVGVRYHKGFYYQTVLLRYNLDGAQDTTFGKQGHVCTEVQDNMWMLINIQRDGKIVVVGRSTTTSGIAVARYTKDGAIDHAFGSNGLVEIPPFADGSPSISPEALSITPAGNILALGSYSQFMVTKLTPAGIRDKSFGTNGNVAGPFSSGVINATHMRMQRDGKIVIAEYHRTIEPGINDVGTSILRYNNNGTPDNHFGVNGKLTLPRYTHDGQQVYSDVVKGFALRENGNYLLMRSIEDQQNNQYFILTQYNPDGGVDTHFGTNGCVVQYPSMLVTHLRGTHLVLQEDGKIIVAGVATGCLQDRIFLTRYTANGTLDTTFGIDGFYLVQSDSKATDRVDSITVDSQNAITIAGSRDYKKYRQAIIVRYNPTQPLRQAPVQPQAPEPMDSDNQLPVSNPSLFKKLTALLWNT